MLGTAIGVGTVQGLGLTLFTDANFRGCTAHRAGLRDFKFTLCLCYRNTLGNDFICLNNFQGINYKVYVTDFAEAVATANTYKVTI